MACHVTTELPSLTETVWCGAAGPEHWAELGYTDCQKHRQSPIGIETSSTIRKRMKPMEFYHFDEIPLNMTLTNNFHSGEWDNVGGVILEFEEAKVTSRD